MHWERWSRPIRQSAADPPRTHDAGLELTRYLPRRFAFTPIFVQGPRRCIPKVLPLHYFGDLCKAMKSRPLAPPSDTEVPGRKNVVRIRTIADLRLQDETPISFWCRFTSRYCHLIFS